MKLNRPIKKIGYADTLRAMQVGDELKVKIDAQNATSFRRARLWLKRKGEGEWMQESSSKFGYVKIVRIA